MLIQEENDDKQTLSELSLLYEIEKLLSKIDNNKPLSQGDEIKAAERIFKFAIDFCKGEHGIHNPSKFSGVEIFSIIVNSLNEGLTTNHYKSKLESIYRIVKKAEGVELTDDERKELRSIFEKIKISLQQDINTYEEDEWSF